MTAFHVRADSIYADHRNRTAPALETPGTVGLRCNADDPRAHLEVTRVVDGAPAMAHPFYDAQRAARALKDREALAEFDGFCKGVAGEPRVNRCTTTGFAAAWDRGYDAGVVRAAVRRLAQPESERRIA